MKRFFIALQLLVFMIIGVVGILFFSTVLVDYVSGGRIDDEVIFITSYAETHDEKLLADKIWQLTAKYDMKGVIDLCEKVDAKVTIYKGYSRPVYSNMIFNTMSREEEIKKATLYNDYDGYSIYLLIQGNTLNVENIKLYGNIWRRVSAHLEQAMFLLALCVLLFGMSIWLLHKFGDARSKIWNYTITTAVFEAGIMLLINPTMKNRIFIFLLVEKVIVILIALLILRKLKRIYGSFQKVVLQKVELEGNERTTESFSFKSVEKNIESTSDYVAAVVNEKLKSERMRTELITNVSHDLKTPLTSVINFSDLISKEAEPGTTIAEYSEHLHNQSVKLKELLDALLEATKASSGNVEMNMEKCSVRTLLEQCVVEYEERLTQAQITLVEKYPDEDIEIMADVNALHRIFDNVLINICKYAMPGTRAYLDAVNSKGKVIISFRNTSREPLNISADELTERFVRGDMSRHSEGFGLGLFVVKSLMELMNAEAVVSINADLFIVELEFLLVN